MNIQISESIQQQLIGHAKQELPNECCGYITGIDNICLTVYEMMNVDASPVHFTFDPKEQFSVIKDARKNGQKPLVVYHSHPESEARLSNEDLRLLTDPDMVYVIISLEQDVPDIKAYQIVDGNIKDVMINEEDYNVIQ